MKRFSTYFMGLLAVAGLVALNACDTTPEEPVDPPTITVTATSTAATVDDAAGTVSGTVGDVVDFSVSISAPGNFNVARISKSVDGGNATILDEVPRDAGTDEQTTYSGSYSYTLLEEEVGATVVLTFLGVDDLGKSAEVAYTITTEAATTPATSYSATLLYVPLGGATNTETFFSTDDGDTYSRDDVENTAEAISPKVDFGYYYGATDNASLASPAEYPSLFQDLSAWGTRNATIIATTTLTTEDYNGFTTNEAIDAAFANIDLSSEDGTVTGLQVGSIVAFQLAADKGALKGFIRVINVTGTFNENDNIELEVVVQSAQ